jgi:hypothetical protein
MKGGSATDQVRPAARIVAGASQLCAFIASENQNPNMVNLIPHQYCSFPYPIHAGKGTYGVQVLRSRGVTSRSIFVLIHPLVLCSTSKPGREIPCAFITERRRLLREDPSRWLPLFVRPLLDLLETSAYALAKNSRHVSLLLLFPSARYFLNFRIAYPQCESAKESQISVVAEVSNPESS